MSFDRPGTGCTVVAEVAQAHDGSLGTAHAYIDAVALTGADAVKFQTHIADAESSPQEPWRVRFSPQDSTRYDYWKRLEFSKEQWAGLKSHAEQKGLKFLSSPFSLEAAELLAELGVSAWKIASGEVNNVQLLDCIARTGSPVLLSTGMSAWAEIDSAVHRIKARHLPIVVMQCTSSYPCPPEKIGLNLISELRERYGAGAGLSDHSGTIYPGLAAAMLGVDVLEVHITLSRESFGPDVSSSLTTAEMRDLVKGIRFIEAMKANPVDKDAVAHELAPLRKMFTKSIVVRRDLAAGSVIRDMDLALRKPGTGIAADRIHDVVGKILQRSVQAGEFLQESDLCERSAVAR